MGRWEPNARERLQEAAMQLFKTRGYDGTTVQDIAERAGLTERTFFRYFADKREALFAGSRDLKGFLTERILGAPPELGPLHAVTGALEALGDLLQDRRELARARRAVVAAHPELQERDQAKLRALFRTVHEALRTRGVAEPAATLAAEAGIAVFKVGYERWLDELKASPGGLAHHVRAAQEELFSIVGGGKAASASRRVRATKPARRASKAVRRAR